MRSQIIFAFLALGISTLAQAGVADKIIQRMRAGVYQGADCEATVTVTQADQVSITLNVGVDTTATFSINDSSPSHTIIKDVSNERFVDVTVRFSPTKVQRLLISPTTISVHDLKRGISGRMNTIRSTSCDIRR